MSKALKGSFSMRILGMLRLLGLFWRQAPRRGGLFITWGRIVLQVGFFQNGGCLDVSWDTKLAWSWLGRWWVKLFGLAYPDMPFSEAPLQYFLWLAPLGTVQPVPKTVNIDELLAKSNWLLLSLGRTLFTPTKKPVLPQPARNPATQASSSSSKPNSDLRLWSCSAISANSATASKSMLSWRVSTSHSTHVTCDRKSWLWKIQACFNMMLYIKWYIYIYIWHGAILLSILERTILYNQNDGHLGSSWILSTPPKTNMEPENRPSQKESRLPTIHFQGLCWFQGTYIFY